MKIIATSLDHGQLKHTELDLPEGFLDLSFEFENGAIFQIVADDNEDALHISEKTYRKLAIEPKSTNLIKIKGV